MPQFKEPMNFQKALNVAAKQVAWMKLSQEDLNKRTTRELLEMLQFSRSVIICSCGHGHHCGDDVLRPGDREHNAKKHEFKERVKIALNTQYGGIAREHIPSKPQARAMRRASAGRTEKKQMTFRK